MTASHVPILDVGMRMIDREGRLTDYGYAFLLGLWQRTGGEIDKIEQALGLAAGAVPQGTVVAATGGLQQGGALGGSIGIVLYRAVTVAASLPASGNAAGDWAWATNGRKPGEAAGAGTGVPCFWSGANWYSATSGAVVTT